VKNKPKGKKYAESPILNFLLEVIYLKKLLNQDFINFMKPKETERQRDRETERQRDRETERQRDRETERQRDRETETERQ
jgi:hypothetical protein